MRRAAKVDGNHRELLDLAKRLGGFVVDCKSLGQGNPDAFVFIRTHWRAVEIKQGTGTLTKQQKVLHAQCPITIWRTSTDVLEAFGVQSPRDYQAEDLCVQCGVVKPCYAHDIAPKFR